MERSGEEVVWRSPSNETQGPTIFASGAAPAMTKPYIAHVHDDIRGAALALDHVTHHMAYGRAYSSCMASGLRSALGPCSGWSFPRTNISRFCILYKYMSSLYIWYASSIALAIEKYYKIIQNTV